MKVIRKIKTRIAFWLLRNTTLEWLSLPNKKRKKGIVYVDGVYVDKVGKWSHIAIDFGELKKIVG